MVAAGLLARNAVRRGLRVPPWVKTSLAPGSRVVTAYLERAGLRRRLDELGFQTVGYGCMTCIGNSGDCSRRSAAAAVRAGAGWRRCCRATATSTAGSTTTSGSTTSPRRRWSSPTRWPGPSTSTWPTSRSAPTRTGGPVLLADLWPDDARGRGGRRRARCDAGAVRGDVRATSSTATSGGRRARGRPGDAVRLGPSRRPTCAGRRSSTLRRTAGARDLVGARVLAQLGDSVTTDHISPAGRIPSGTAAGRVPPRPRCRGPGPQHLRARGAATSR